MAEAIEREKAFYGEALERATSGAASTGYGIEFNQTMRFLELEKQLDLGNVGLGETISLLDVGSGTGDLYVYLREHGLTFSDYLGVDILPEMTRQATKNLEEFDPDGPWRLTTGSIVDEHVWAKPPLKYDYVVSVAAYALKEEHSSQQEELLKVQHAINTMVSKARKAVFVTLFSTWKTNIIPEEMVLDPVTVFAWAKSKWERVDLIHSYAPFDFSLVIKPEKSPWREEWEAHQGLQAAADRLKETVVRRA